MVDGAALGTSSLTSLTIVSALAGARSDEESGPITKPAQKACVRGFKGYFMCWLRKRLHVGLLTRSAFRLPNAHAVNGVRKEIIDEFFRGRDSVVGRVPEYGKARREKTCHPCHVQSSRRAPKTELTTEDGTCSPLSPRV